MAMAIIISGVLVCAGVFAYQYYNSIKKNENIPAEKSVHEKMAWNLVKGYLEAYKFPDVVLPKRIKSYLINKIDIDIEKDNCFGFIVDFSVNTLKSQNDGLTDWIAGNGEADGDWVKNKTMFMNAVGNDVSGFSLRIAGTARKDNDCTTGSPISPVEIIKK